MQMTNKNAKSRQNRKMRFRKADEFKARRNLFNSLRRLQPSTLKRGFAFSFESDDSSYKAVSYVGGVGRGWFSTTPEGALGTLVYPHLRHQMQSLLSPRVFETNPPPPPPTTPKCTKSVDQKQQTNHSLSIYQQ